MCPVGGGPLLPKRECFIDDDESADVLNGGMISWSREHLHTSTEIHKVATFGSVCKDGFADAFKWWLLKRLQVVALEIGLQKTGHGMIQSMAGGTYHRMWKLCWYIVCWPTDAGQFSGVVHSSIDFGATPHFECTVCTRRHLMLPSGQDEVGALTEQNQRYLAVKMGNENKHDESTNQHPADAGSCSCICICAKVGRSYVIVISRGLYADENQISIFTTTANEEEVRVGMTRWTDLVKRGLSLPNQ